jgi:hypothetical protein
MFIELPPGLGTLGEAIDSTVSFGVAIIGTILGALFGGIFGGGDVAALNSALQQLRDAVATAIDDLQRFAWQSLTALGKLLSMIHDLLVNFLDDLWQLLKKLAGTIAKLLKEALPAIVKAIQLARQALADLYQKYIRPILVYLQYIRRYLAILRAFHIKWAGQLDSWLSNLQSRIIGPYLYMLGLINGVANWVNLILTAGLILQRPLFINTMYAYQKDWITMWWTGQVTAAGAAGAPPASSQVTPPSNAQVQADFSAFVSADAGPYAQDAATANQVLQQTLAGA